MAKLIRYMKGLYSLIENNSVLPIPIRREMWSVFLAVCHAHGDIVPSAIQLGSYLELKGDPSDEERGLCLRLIIHSEKLTDDAMALFQYYPDGLAAIVEHHVNEAGCDPLPECYTIGWKKSYYWRPL